MNRLRLHLAAWIALLAFSLILQSSSAAASAWPQDPLTTLRIAPSASSQGAPRAVADGQGGAFVAFTDDGSGNQDIFLQRVTSRGETAPGWPAAGLAICSASGDQILPVAISDGAGGVIVAWEDNRAGNADVYAIRIGPFGARAPGWPADGRQLTSDVRNESVPRIAPDDRHGAFVAWTLDFGPGDLDVYAGHVDSTGTIVWISPIANPAFHQYDPALAPDGTGGVLITYTDDLSGNPDIRAARRAADGTGIYGPVDVCTHSAQQYGALVTGEGTGRAIIVWTDLRFANYDVFAMILAPGGARTFGFPPDGNPICTAPRTQWRLRLAPDGSGGAYIAWEDERNFEWDVFVHRLLASGAEAPGWPADGFEVCTVAGNQYVGDLAPDGLSGAILTWEDRRLPVGQDVYALRVLPSGATAPGWVVGGTPVTVGMGASDPSLAVDSAGNTILAWADEREAPFSICAQRVEVFGQFGNPEPSLAGVHDVLGDQGGRVRIDWTASYLDVNPTFGVSAYWIWRQAPAARALFALESGGRLLSVSTGESSAGFPVDDPGALPQGGLWMTTVADATMYYWEFLASVPASGFPAYSYVAATTTDSTGSANPYTPFLVQARAPSGVAFWSSAPDSGYSVDNLPPTAPNPFTGLFDGSVTHLHWGANVEADLFGYRLYRGSSADFVPGPGNLVSAQPDTGYVDSGLPGSWYKLSAVDVHDNESPYAVLAPTGTVAAPEVLPLVLALAPAQPNPAATSASFRLALPSEGRVRLVAYDARGRRVRTLVDGALPVGFHDIAWNLADDHGRAVRSGRYFVRLEVREGVRIEPITVVR